MSYIQKIFNIENKNDFKFINKYFFISKFLILIVFLYLRFISPDNFNHLLLNFDGIHYYNIGLKGYESSFEYAFFPLFPIIIHLFYLLKIPIMGTLIFNFIINYISTILIYKFSKRIYLNSDETTHKTILLWLFSPIAIFNTVLYSEPLFIFLSLSAFYFYKVNRQLILCGILLGLSVCTRNFASMLFVSIFILIIINILKEKKQIIKKQLIINIIKIYIPATLFSISYPVYLFFNTGSWKTFINVQFEYWYRMQSNFILMIIYDIELIINNTGITEYVNIFNFILLYPLLIFYIYLIIVELRKQRILKLELILFTLLTFICITSTMRFDNETPTTCSLYRYLYSLFPLYLLINDDINIRYFQFYALICELIVCFFYFFDIFLC